MSENSTDRICKALEAKAFSNLRDNLQRAANEYNKAIGLSGTSEGIKLKGTDGQEFIVYTSDILDAITKQLSEKRKEKACSDEVNNFLNGVEKIQSQFHSIEQYLEDYGH